MSRQSRQRRDDVGQQTTPIVADGVIYVDTPNGEVIAVDGKTGDANWKWSPEDFGTNGTRRGVSLGDGKIYTLADGDRVVALDKDTGEEVWVVQPEAPDGASLGGIEKVATVYHDGLVYVHTNDGDRGAVFALNSSDGSLVWHFFGGPDRGIVFTDIHGNSVDAGATWGPVLPDGTECNLEGGATPWMHGAVDPGLGMYYMSFGNARSCTSSQNGSLRPGDNLFASTMVAVDFKTGDVQVALPVDPPRRVGHGQRPPADPGRYRGRRRGTPGGVLRQQVGSPVRARPDQPACPCCRSSTSR